MNGLQAIIATESWKIAIIAPTIVFISLSLLAVMVGVMEKAINYWDHFNQTLTQLFTRQEPPTQDRTEQKRLPDSPPEDHVLPLNEEERQTAQYLEMVVQRLGQPFTLDKLKTMAENMEVSHTPEHIERLQETGCIVESDDPEEKGLYYWRGL